MTIPLLELLPLPSPSTSTWIYGAHSNLPELRDRNTYATAQAPSRAAALRMRIAQHRPKVVVFCGAGYRTWWEQIAGSALIPAEEGGVHSLTTSGTFFVMIKAPATTGITNDYFVQAGEIVHRHLGGAGTARETPHR